VIAVRDRAVPGVDPYHDRLRCPPGRVSGGTFYQAQRNLELEQAQRQNDHDLAARLHELLRTDYGLPEPGLATRCLVAVQVADHLLGLAFRDNPDGDATV
jgi:hypothetical protein